MVQADTYNETRFKQWHQRRLSKQLLEQELIQQGLPVEEVTSVLDHYVRYRVGRRNTIGWSLMGLGGFLGLVSCVLTILDALPDLRGFFMYGLTTVAVSIAFYGCRLVLEKGRE